MNDVRWFVVLVVCMTFGAGAGAATYRCLGADGKVTYGDRPCEASQQTVATLGAKGKAVVPPAAAASTSASGASAAAATASGVSPARATPPR